MNKALDLLREIRPSIPKEVLELWCKDRDAFLASHPAVEQAGGDERAKFEYWASDEGIYPKAVERSGNCYKLAQTQSYWMAWQARAALAQPSPKCATCGGTGMVDDGEIDCYSDGTPFENGPVKCVKDCPACKAQPSPLQAEQPTADDYEEVLDDHRRLVREMDVLLNGEACAAKQAMLCDLVSQVEAEARKSGQPLLVSAERYRWLRNDDNWGADDSEGQGTSKWANLGELSGTDFDAYLDQLRGYNPVMDIDPEHSKAIAKRGRDAIVAQAEGAPVIGCLCGMPMTEGRHSPGGCTSLEEFAPHLSAQAQAKQAEQPEVVARVDGTDEDWFIQPEDETELHNEGLLFAGCELGRMIDFDRIVGALRAENAKLSEALDECDGDRWKLRSERDAANARLHEVATACATAEQERDAALAEVERLREENANLILACASLDSEKREMQHKWDSIIAMRDAALARVAELERQEPVVRAYGVLPPFAEKVLAKLRRFYDCAEDFESGGVDIGRHWLDLLTQLGLLNRVQRSPALWEISQQGEDLLEAPVAQAQHSVPEGWMLMPVEPLLNMMSDKDHDTRITAERQLLSILADVPSNSVPQAWIDVQAERRRQITAEGWTPEHDDLYCAAELPRAAAAYILNGANDEAPAIWPFVTKWWKPRDARSNYVRAGALILAEIERLDRAAAAGKEVGHE
ncbi:hypothetical protein [Pseudomonas aeruginosa]|uniref:hypothetical protein n=1 Tax=Pseudomonas aeruginosa TaxID=287 RepID=UPI0021F17D7B|nr:hypothetical protein [Pseudomonas aeruginosa]MCV6567519.1 hypothetical protein [Pseudomonas aeruginosa]